MLAENKSIVRDGSSTQNRLRAPHHWEIDIMRMQLTTGSAIESVVTLAAAAMMTLAAFAMVDDVVPSNAGPATLAACRAGPGANG